MQNTLKPDLSFAKMCVMMFWNIHIHYAKYTLTLVYHLQVIMFWNIHIHVCKIHFNPHNYHLQVNVMKYHTFIMQNTLKPHLSFAKMCVIMFWNIHIHYAKYTLNLIYHLQVIMFWIIHNHYAKCTFNRIHHLQVIMFWNIHIH